jgi:hypothetical protein
LFLVASAIGVAMAFALAGRAPAALLRDVPSVHASVGIIGWLTILIMGVSARTIRPMTGARTRFARAHIAAGALEVCGLAFFSSGVLLGAAAVTWVGLLAIFLGASIYALDIADILRRATVGHRPPQAFVAAGVFWLLTGLLLTLCTAAGAPWGTAAAYVMLIGWAGQLVNGHIHHIGVRLIATIVLGDDDETRPGELLAAPLSWTAFALFQIAVALGAIALVTSAANVLVAAALAGFTAWVALVANLAHAIRSSSLVKALA